MLTILLFPQLIDSRTEFSKYFFPFLSIILVSALECFQSPKNPIRFDSVVLSGQGIRGSTKCFLDSVYNDYYMSVQINKLDLKGDCPSFSVSEYSTLRSSEIPESENFPSIKIYQPSDDNRLFKATCETGTEFIGTVFQTSMPGRKLMVEFDPADFGDANSFEITVTPFFLGNTFSCPAEHFRCFNSRDHCIPNSITCDGVDNCFDGSDESNYLCTGRIGNLPLPLFIILVLVALKQAKDGTEMRRYLPMMSGKLIGDGMRDGWKAVQFVSALVISVPSLQHGASSLFYFSFLIGLCGSANEVAILVLLGLITGLAIYLRRRHFQKQRERPECIDMNIIQGQSTAQEPLMPPPPPPTQTH
ncbi:unnamed protein product [Hydatigera taeniaeformis]|uniref:Low-density lipoprotein receptor domain class A n=1 Tax=Hydatigena taeniaeformis TaxID=6205 RepID=A0A0R3WZA9_HYDTA|nr:unnamed protein product [Hydatigera taeniaeformis]